MRKLILKIDVSLDGFISGPNGESDWIFESTDVGCTTWVLEAVWRAGLHVMGRKTFEDMARYWPRSRNVFAEPMNTIPKLVFTRSRAIDFGALFNAAPPPGMTRAPIGRRRWWRASPEETKQNQTSWREALVASDLVGEITRQKVLPGKAMIAYGGGTFVRELIKHDLVDEYRLVVHPVALGKGLPIFDGLEKPRALKLVSSSAFPAGATAQILVRAS